ncbi:interleukin-7 receptor subunit alpha [Microcaecilia unicolor]|uniref:Interleukin-7 receptor subunit alpha n=1 Tax=Microcaecilia unicolor TaxID=1415580 RepID=A0A6P7X5M8_9AMPH|nr:interleukin-7 receptor subunit alpha [Microcaecilia unicolor]
MITTYFCALLLLHVAYGQSGGQQTGLHEDDDDDLNYDFECFINLDISGNILTCYPVDLDSNVHKVTFSVCSSSNCFKLKKEDGWTLKSIELTPLSNLEVCMDLTLKKRCKSYKPTKIIKPYAPFNVTVTYQERGKEYHITFNVTYSSFDYLHNKLEHQIAYRMEDENWEYKNIDFLEIKLLERELKPGAKYEVKVRSMPKGEYFNGTWSDWSSSEYFEAAIQQKDNSEMTIILPILACFIVGIVIVLVITLWGKRIKSTVWTEIPDHKSTLEKLCKKTKTNLDTSFDPKCFLDFNVHKIDAFRSKTELEHLPDASHIQDVSSVDKNWRGLGLNMSQQFEPENNLKGPVTYRGTWPSHSRNGQCTKNSSASLHTLIGPAVLINQGSNGFSSETTALTNQSRPHFINSNRAVQTEPAKRLKALGPKEAYVTMSAFMTTTKLQGT